MPDKSFLELLSKAQSDIGECSQKMDNEIALSLYVILEELEGIILDNPVDSYYKDFSKSHAGFINSAILSYFHSIIVMFSNSSNAYVLKIINKLLEFTVAFTEMRKRLNNMYFILECVKTEYEKAEESAETEESEAERYASFDRLLAALENNIGILMEMASDIESEFGNLEQFMDSGMRRIVKDIDKEFKKKLALIEKCINAIVVVILVCMVILAIAFSVIIILALLARAIYQKLTAKQKNSSEQQTTPGISEPDLQQQPSSINDSKNGDNPDPNTTNDNNGNHDTAPVNKKDAKKSPKLFQLFTSTATNIKTRIQSHLLKPVIKARNEMTALCEQQFDELKEQSQSLAEVNPLLTQTMFKTNVNLASMSKQMEDREAAREELLETKVSVSSLK